MIDVECAPDKPAGSEPVNPFRIETDDSGQKWRVGPDGSKLKVGGTIGPGAPKKEVRELATKGAHSSVKWALRVMDSNLPDSDPTKIKAVELLLRYGLGTSDEVELTNEKQTLEALVRSLQGEVESEQAKRIAAKFADILGIK